MRRRRLTWLAAPLLVLDILSVASCDIERESNTIVGLARADVRVVRTWSRCGSTPLQSTIVVGETIDLAGEPVDAQGNVLIGRSISWKASDEDIAKVMSIGVVTGLAVGSVTVAATVSDVIGTAFVVVNSASAPVEK